MWEPWCQGAILLFRHFIYYGQAQFIEQGSHLRFIRTLQVHDPPRGLIRKTCRRPRRCWKSSGESMIVGQGCAFAQPTNFAQDRLVEG